MGEVKIGDRVRVRRPRSLNNGKTGSVRSVVDWQVIVTLDGRLGDWWFDAHEIEVIHAFTRDDMVRVVLASQWAVAVIFLTEESCSVWDPEGSFISSGYCSRPCAGIANLPSPVEVVAQILGGE